MNAPKPLTRAQLARLREVVERMTLVEWVFAVAPTDDDANGIAALRNAAEALIGQVEGAMDVIEALEAWGSSRDLDASRDTMDGLRATIDIARALLAAYDADEGGRHG